MSMNALSRQRARLTATNYGPGSHFTSPQKGRAPKRKAEQKATTFLDIENKRRRLQEQFESLLSSSSSTPLNSDSFSTADNTLEAAKGMVTNNDDSEPDDQWVDEPETAPCQPPTPKILQAKKRRTIPDFAAQNLYAKWRVLLPSLVEPLLGYLSDSVGKPLQSIDENLKAKCQGGSRRCEVKNTAVLCLYFDCKYHYSVSVNIYHSEVTITDFKTVNVEHCSCNHISSTLVRHGLFPTAPEQIRMAVSIDFLDFYGALFERSCDAVNAMAAALNTFYTRRGYFLMNTKVRYDIDCN